MYVLHYRTVSIFRSLVTDTEPFLFGNFTPTLVNTHVGPMLLSQFSWRYIPGRRYISTKLRELFRERRAQPQCLSNHTALFLPLFLYRHCNHNDVCNPSRAFQLTIDKHKTQTSTLQLNRTSAQFNQEKLEVSRDIWIAHDEQLIKSQTLDLFSFQLITVVVLYENGS